MLVYFDTNVFAHVNQAGEEQAFAEWLAGRGDRALLSYHHLWESLAIDGAELRRRRVLLLRSIPCEYLDYLAYLEAHEFLGEVRRLRPGWLARFPDPGQAEVHLRFHRKLWHIAEHEGDAAKWSTDVVRQMTQARRDRTTEALKTLRKYKQDCGAALTEMTLGDATIELGAAGAFADPVAFWRRQAMSNWHGALLGGDAGVSDWVDYIGGYLDMRAVTTRDFAHFWLDDVRSEAMPRSFVQWASIVAQLDMTIRSSGMLDTDHVAAALGTDAFVTEDNDLASVFERVRELEGRLPEPYLARRGERSAVAAVDAAMPPRP